MSRMGAPRDLKDRIGKRLFRNPRMVRDMLGAFVPARWTAGIDADTLRELPGELINERGDKRLADLLWLADAPDGAPVLVMLENQSTPGRRMAARMMTQAGLLYETLSGRARGLDGKFPPLLAVVVYTGVSRWREPEDLAVLVRASDGAMVELYGRRYRLLDLGALAGEHLPRCNRLTVLVRLTFLESAFDAGRVLAEAREWMDIDDEDEQSLYQGYLDWFYALMPDYRPEGWDPTSGRRPEELMGEVSMLQRNTERAIERYRREGIEQGFQRERALLCRLATRRFGDDLGRRLGARLADVKDPILFDKVGDLVLECATGEELLSGVNGMAAGDR